MYLIILIMDIVNPSAVVRGVFTAPAGDDFQIKILKSFSDRIHLLFQAKVPHRHNSFH